MNRTSTAVAVIAAISIIATAMGQAPPRNASISAGRYQLLNGEHQVTSKTGLLTEHVFLRIDTATGETSEYESGQSDDGKFRAFWLPITEKP